MLVVYTTYFQQQISQHPITKRMQSSQWMMGVRRLTVPLCLMLLFLVGCSADQPLASDSIACQLLDDGLFTMRLLGVFGVLIALSVFALKNVWSQFAPTNVQTSAVIIGLGTGLAAFALTTEIGGNIFTTLGLPNVVQLCGL